MRLIEGMQIIERVRALVVILALASFLMTVPPLWAQGGEEGLEVEKGFDVFRTLPGFESEQGFGECPIPGLTFESASDEVLTGCETFDGFVQLIGAPLEKFRGQTVGAVDTIVERKQDLDFGQPEEDVTLAIDVELVALKLLAATLIEIQCDQGLTLWDVAVEVDQTTGPSEGEMSVTLDHPELAGGTVSSVLNVCPRVTFTRVDPEGSGSFEFFPCDLACGPQLFGETGWSFEPPGGAQETLKIEGFTTDNFFFVEAAGAAAALTSKMDLECECGFVYPHLEPNHRHQACEPCPCDVDIDFPFFTVLPEDLTVECTERRDGMGGAPATDPFIRDFLNRVECEDATSPIDFCGAVDPPDFFFLGPPEDPPMHCVGQTTVEFLAEDECENRTSAERHVKVQDTTAPDVTVCSDTSGDCDLACVAPPNGGVHCFTQDEGAFELDQVRQQLIGDTCSDVVDWVFAECNTLPGNGSDCTIGLDQRSICVTSRRPRNEDRRYEVKIEATDACGNTSDATTIGFVHIETAGQASDDCIIVTPPCRPACSAEPTSGEAPLTVSFSDETQCRDISVESWTWDFGDGTGTVQNGPNTTHEYTEAGTYSPRLEITLEGVEDPVTVSCGTVEVEEEEPATCFVDLGQGGGVSMGEPIDVAQLLQVAPEDVVVTGIEQDEPLSGPRCGNFEPDGCINDPPSTVEIRPEACSGPAGNDRFYHITFELREGVESPCPGNTITVCKPQNQGGGGTCADANDGGSLVDSTGGGQSCPL